jgi:acetoin utilization protein AcuB
MIIGAGPKMKKDELCSLRRTRSPANRSSKATQVRHWMTVTPITIGSKASLGDAIRLLVKHNIRELPVVDRGKLIGIVTDRDLRQVAPSYPLFRDEQEIRHHLDTMKISCAMTPDPLVVSPTADLVTAASLLIKYRINSLPVVHDKRLVGIISVTDVLRLFVEQNSQRGSDEASRHYD